MICPKCGNEVDLFADKCLKCSKSFKNLSVEKRLEMENRYLIDKNKTTPVRMTYDNGIAVGEGMSVKGGKQRKGAHRPFLYKY